MALVQDDQDFAMPSSHKIREDVDGKNEEEIWDDATFGCGRLRALPHISDLTPSERMCIRANGYIEKVRGQVARPPRSLPPLHLPAWAKMPLDAKLPVVPKALKGTLFYARGLLGQKLYQPPRTYTNEDPFNHERVIQEPYNALHDPHMKTFLEKPEKREFLLKQGLITRTGQVLCRPKDFNQYRAYLNTLYKDDIHKVIADLNAQCEGNREMDRALHYFLSKTEGDFYKRMGKLVEKRRIMQMETAQKHKIKERMEEDRMINMAVEKERLQRIREVRAIQMEAQRRKRIQNKLKQEKIAREITIANMLSKEERVEERVAYEKELINQAYRQYVLEWMDTKWESQEAKVIKDEQLEESYAQTMKERADRRQKRAEKYREQLPDILVRQKAKRERLWNIVRKYFYRWLNNVRKRRERKPDAMHQSLWDTTVVVEETLKYLRQQSGYEKLDDFILSILKLKRDIKNEMALEEAMDAQNEAAGATATNEGQEEDDGGGDDEPVLGLDSGPEEEAEEVEEVEEEEG